MSENKLSLLFRLGPTATSFDRSEAGWELRGEDSESVVLLHNNWGRYVTPDYTVYSGKHRWYDLHCFQHKWKISEKPPVSPHRLRMVLCDSPTVRDRTIGLLLLMIDHGVPTVFNHPLFTKPLRTEFLDEISPFHFTDDPPSWLPRNIKPYVNWWRTFPYLADEIKSYRRYISYRVPTLEQDDTALEAADKAAGWIGRLRALYEHYSEDRRHYEWCSVPQLGGWHTFDGYYGWELRIDGFLVQNFSPHRLNRVEYIPALKGISREDDPVALEIIEDIMAS